jgi:Acyl-CoA reductase (LuxC)
MSDPEFMARRARLEPLFESARSLADPATARGLEARQRLVRATGLAPEGVELALSRCLESAPSESDIEALIRSTPTAQVAHVLLSAQVFVATHRAIAIGLAASERVFVRASRREPEMAELLLAGAPNSFQLVSELSPHAGDRLWAYGSDESLDEVSVTLPAGVAFHAHGSGFGVCVIDGQIPDSELSDLLPRLACDVALFDQRGCLSPRTLLVAGGPEYARDVALALASELAALSERVPLGRLDAAELAEIIRFRDSATFAGELFAAGPGFVSAGKDETWTLPPIGRNVHVLPSSDPIKTLMNVRPMITSCAFAGDPALAKTLRRSLPGARICKFGEMQSPPLDGPVDRRDL